MKLEKIQKRFFDVDKSIHLVLFNIITLAGIGGGILGRRLNRKLTPTLVDRLFLGMMVLIQLICVYNLIRFAGVRL